MTGPLLYAPAHTTHAPAVEFDQGRLAPYHDTPARIEVLLTALSAQGLTPHAVTTPLALTTLATVHAPSLLATLAALADSAAEADYCYPEAFPIRPDLRHLTPDTASPLAAFGAHTMDYSAPVGRHTWEAARLSAAVAVHGADLLLTGASPHAYALCRPPGHHAGPAYCGGYCYLNNAALAAHHLRALGRVAVLDLDYHHGNGTQAIFWDDPDVFFGSLHADPRVEYPYHSGYADETGGPSAPGTTHNIPLPYGTTGAQYLAALDTLLAASAAHAPAAYVISLGYDTCADDPLGQFLLQPADYHAIGARLAALKRPTLFVQEGGYAVAHIGYLAQALWTGFTQ